MGEGEHLANLLGMLVSHSPDYRGYGHVPQTTDLTKEWLLKWKSREKRFSDPLEEAKPALPERGSLMTPAGHLEAPCPCPL